MKVYNRIKFDIDTWDVLEEDSFDYDGPILQAQTCIEPHCTNQGCTFCAVNAPTCPGNVTAFPANPVSAGVTTILADHINRMRNALDDEKVRRLQGSCGIGGWASKAIGSVITGSDYDNLKSCNNTLQYFPGNGDALTLISDTYGAGTIITALDTNNMMSAVNLNEARCMCDSDCGANDCFCICDGDCGSCNYT
jgi:hypothetical protein